MFSVLEVQWDLRVKMLSPYLTGDYGDTLSLQFLLYVIVSHLFHCHADKHKQTRLRQNRLRCNLSTVVT